ncbi:hypothetical protein ACH495_06795 [Micromonospora sp. NPDC018662]|uniref:hypothetical protein n=1 Tax=Micromonospora sp. NPDC018662 TaxID=3364238 RepID=UPI00379CE573
MRVRDRLTAVVVTLAFALTAFGPPLTVTAAPVAVGPATVTAAPVAVGPATVTAAPVAVGPATVTAAPVTAAPVTAAPVTAAPVTAGPATVTAAPVAEVAPSAAGPACRTSTRADARRPAYPQRLWAQVASGSRGPDPGGVAYGDGPDDPVPVALPGVGAPVVAARGVPGHERPAGPPPRGMRAARAPPVA